MTRPLALACLLTSAGLAAAQTTVRVTDEVQLDNVYRIGIHYSGGNPDESPFEKRPIELNFEGTLYRVMLAIDGMEGNKAFTTTLAPDTERRDNPFLDIIKGGTYHVLSGPDQWKSGKVVDVVQEPFTNPNNNQEEVRPALVLDKPFTMVDRTGWHSNGVMVERLINEGNIGRMLIWDYKPDAPISTYRGYEVPEDAELVQGDTSPETFGGSALLLPASKGDRTFRAALQTVWPYPGHWRIGVWAKARGDGANLTVRLPGVAVRVFPLTQQWKHYEAEFDEKIDRPLFLEIGAAHGDVLIDDLTADILGDENPTAFRDVLVEMLRKHRPGTMRLLHNTAGTAENIIKPALQQYAVSGSTYGSFYHRKPGHHEFYELCEAVGCDVWAPLPGTLLPEDVRFYIEWLAGPVTTPGGALRAKLGRDKPWTEAFDRIYLQFGNEAVTFGGTGYTGPDYWNNLIAVGKASPWFDPQKMKFVVDAQPSLSQNLEKTPNADLLNINNYHIKPGLYADEVERFLDTDEKLARYVFAAPYALWMNDPKYAPDSQWGAVHLSRRFDKPIVIYEGGNYHSTHGTASEQLRNKYITGAVGGLSMANNMLWIEKNMNVTAQNQFTLSQFQFTGAGAFGDGATVRLWGQVINPVDPDTRRFRPAYLGVELANRLIYGRLMKTVHEGEDPTFSSTGLFNVRIWNERQYAQKKDEFTTVENVPALYSYAFNDGDRHSLILVSYLLDRTQKITIDLPDEQHVAGRFARTWTLHADSMWANNEPESPTPGVRIEAGRLDAFRDGVTVDLPPYTMVGLEWYTSEQAARQAPAN